MAEQLCSLTMMSSEASLEGKFEGLPRVLLYNLNNSAIFFNYSDQLLQCGKKNFRNFFFLLLLSNTLFRTFMWNNCDIKWLASNSTWLSLGSLIKMESSLYFCKSKTRRILASPSIVFSTKKDGMMLGIFPPDYFNGQKGLLCSNNYLIWNIHFPGRFYIRKLWI